MEELVKVVESEVFTNSLIIAQGTRNEHNSVTRIIRNYTKDFEDFGEIRFMDLKSKNSKGGRPVKVYLLNEPQATLLMTYLGNNEIVRKFKLELVRQFYAMRQYILEHNSSHWQQTRLESKKTRKLETAEIKELVRYAKAQGSENAENYYILLSKLANKTVGISSKERETATINQLNTLILVENIINHMIQEGIRQELPYKKIYQGCRKRLEEFQKVAFLSGKLIG